MTAEPHNANSDPIQETRGRYPHGIKLPTRWQDQDIYGHVNNVVYYAYFDTVVSGYLVEQGGLDPQAGPVIGLCVESFCRFKRELNFPETVEARLRVAHLGNSSVRYEIGLFKSGLETAAADGHFVHVFVDRDSRQPAPIPASIRTALTLAQLPKP